MSRQLDQKREDRQSLRQERVGKALCGGLDGALHRSGHEFRGFTVRVGPIETLVVVKASVGKADLVAFVGSSSPADALIKAWNLAVQDKLRWREDRYGGSAS